MMMIDNFKIQIIHFVFNFSKQPIKLVQLLEANSHLLDGMHLDGKKLGFRLRVGRAYVLFFILAHLFIVPLSFLTHKLFIYLDCHASILVAVLFTSILFVSFGLFRDWLSDSVGRYKIEKSWSVHFPHFSYKSYANKIDKIYSQSKHKNIDVKDLEYFILDKLS
jgi:hypothetical protein